MGEAHRGRGEGWDGIRYGIPVQAVAIDAIPARGMMRPCGGMAWKCRGLRHFVPVVLGIRNAEVRGSIPRRSIRPRNELGIFDPIREN